MNERGAINRKMAVGDGERPSEPMKAGNIVLATYIAL
jgi:hypothetical protein